MTLCKQSRGRHWNQPYMLQPAIQRILGGNILYAFRNSSTPTIIVQGDDLSPSPITKGACTPASNMAII
jgi:hypothetical protein